MKEPSSVCPAEREAELEMPLWRQAREKDAMMRGAWLQNRVGRVVCSSLELAQTLLPNTLPSSMVALTQNRDRMFKMENGPFSGFGLF